MSPPEPAISLMIITLGDRKSTRLNSSHTRRSSDLDQPAPGAFAHQRTDLGIAEPPRHHVPAGARHFVDDHHLGRSEEHTSELQSYTTFFRSRSARPRCFCPPADRSWHSGTSTASCPRRSPPFR